MHTNCVKSPAQDLPCFLALRVCPVSIGTATRPFCVSATMVDPFLPSVFPAEKVPSQLTCGKANKLQLLPPPANHKVVPFPPSPLRRPPPFRRCFPTSWRLGFLSRPSLQCPSVPPPTPPPALGQTSPPHIRSTHRGSLTPALLSAMPTQCLRQTPRFPPPVDILVASKGTQPAQLWS